ncbi:MAG: RNA polymerase sigma factor [Phycisphaerae bacterium]
MVPDRTHPSLLQRVRDPNDHAAWADFDRQYRELILRYALARGLQPADAEDVRQIVLMNLTQAMRRFVYNPELGRFRNYLARVVRNAIVRLVERRGPEWALGSSVLATGAVLEDAAADELWEREWVNHHYRCALEALRAAVEPQTLAVFERLISGATAADAAEAFGLTVDAVQKIKQRMRDRLQERIAQQIRQEDDAFSA